MQRIPFVDLLAPHAELADELIAICRDVFRTGAFIGGPVVEAFETEFAKFCKAAHGVGVGSGTDALRFALIASGVGLGDTVLTVPNTFIATTEAISQAGARPDFIDVDERTYTMDPRRLREYVETGCARDSQSHRLISKRTGTPVTAIVPVHLYGQMAAMDEILEIATEFDLLVIEDACQAHGAEYYSKREGRWCTAGSLGRSAAFSFYPGKNLGACGEAGAVTTNDSTIAARCRMLRDHGQSKKYFHDVEGYNGRLDALQAGFLRIKLPHLAAWNELRRTAARIYDSLLADADHVVTPHVPEWSCPVYHLYVIRVTDRETVQHQLTAAGVGTGIHYPVPLHLQRAYHALGYGPGSFPVSERLALEILSLPMFPTLSAEQQRRTVDELLQLTMRTA